MATGYGSAAVMGGIADPRLGDEADNIGKGRQGSLAVNIHDAAVKDKRDRRGSHIYGDTSLQFEDYVYWAQRSREYEKTLPATDFSFKGSLSMLFGKGKHSDNPPQTLALEPMGSDSDKAEEKAPQDAAIGEEGQYGVTESEWENAQRAIRTATWAAIFYLITTDILGPYNVPWAISQMGYGPGFALYTTFGGFAFYSGLQLWQMFVGLDSTRYPLRNYGDLSFRIFGNWARGLANVLQSFQFFLNVALIIEGNGQGLGQMSAGRHGKEMCFLVAEVVFTVIGFVFTQIRTLKNLSWLSNLAIWLNVIVIIMVMAVTNSYPPNYAAFPTVDQTNPPPIVTSAYWPPGLVLSDYISGMMNCVFAYGGATLFNELMAEMRRPMDFWKALLCADIFIYIVYLIMGMVVYSAQGQYTYAVAYQSIPHTAYAWQTLGNAVSFISALIAALLYGNIGIKVFYAAVLRDVFNFPGLETKKGKIIWVFLSPLYWALAFIVAAALPQIANLTAFVGASCIMQFSFTFPPLLKVGYNCQRDAMLEEETFDPATGQVTRVDSGMKRWIRGYKKKMIWNSFDVVYGLGALATAGLGIWASCIQMHAAYAETPITPFTCTNPAG